jgi:hypothetical protein
VHLSQKALMSIDDGRARGFRKVDVIVNGNGVVVGKLFYEKLSRSSFPAQN